MKKLGGIILAAFLFSLAAIPTEARGCPVYTDSEVPEDIQTYSNLCGDEYHICPELLQAIAYYESRFQADATNGKCVGLMQVNVKAHAERIEYYGWTEADMLDPYKNMMVASDYLEELFLEYEDVGLVLCFYNGDMKGLNRYKEYDVLPPYAEKILKMSERLERLANK